MLSHVHVGARNLECLVAFYDALLAKLGLIQICEGNGGSAQGVGWPYPGLKCPHSLRKNSELGCVRTRCDW